MNNQPIQFKDEDVGSILLYHLNEQLVQAKNKSFQDLPTMKTITPYQLKELKSACIDDNDIITLEDLHYTKGLKQLTIYLEKEVDLEPLKYLIDLEDLTLSVPINRTINLSSISHLKKLKRLSIGVYHTKETQSIQNLSFLRDLTNLEDLNLLGLDIKTLEPLSNLTNLKKLKLTQVRNTKQVSPRFEPLTNLINLESLTLREFHQGVDLINLSKRGVIKELYLYNCGIINLTHISHLEKLEKLSLATDQKVLDVTPLTSLKHLRKVGLMKVKQVIIPESLKSKVKILGD